MASAIVTEPNQEPLSIDEIKQHLRIETNNFDSELDGLIQEARRYVERSTGRALITQTWNLKLDGFSNIIKLPNSPLQSVSSITYQDSANATQTLATTYYSVDTLSEPARVVQAYNYTYPSTYDDINSVTIKYVAGYGDDPEDVPERFKRAMKLYIQMAFDGDPVEDALNSIILQDRIVWL